MPSYYSFVTVEEIARRLGISPEQVRRSLASPGAPPALYLWQDVQVWLTAGARLSLTDAAAYLGCSVRTMQRIVARGEVSHLTIGRRQFFTIEQLEDYTRGQ